MFKRGIYSIIILLSALAGWAFGYIRVPYIEFHYSFWIGFFGGLGFFILIYTLWRLSAKQPLWQDEGETVSPDQVHQRIRIVRLTLVLVLTILAISCFNLYQMNRSLAAEVEDCREQVTAAENRIDSIEQSRWMVLMQDALRLADSAMIQSQSGKPSPDAIERIAAISLQFKPYRVQDTINRKLSPQRGQLLLALLKMNWGDSSWNQIKQAVSFEEADLRNANLIQADLSEARLSGADLTGAQLDQARFDRADLSYALMIRTSGKEVDFLGTNLKRANLEWSELSNSDFSKANLDGVKAGNANWKGSRLDSASMQWVDLSNLFCRGCSAEGSRATGANFTASNWSNSRMVGVFWKQSNLEDLLMDNAQVDSSFFDRVELFPGVTGLDQVRNRYRIKSDSTTSQVVYRLSER